MINETKNMAPAAVEPQWQIENLIFTVRGVQVMLDRDLARLYEVTTSALNQAVKRNISRFPEDFRFQLSEKEWIGISSQFVTTSAAKRPKTSLPFVLTEEGVAQLSGVLKSKVACDASVHIMRAFVAMRKFISANAGIFQRIEAVELKQLSTDRKISEILDRLDDGSLKQKLGIFFDGQMFDAYVLVETLFKRATRRIILIDDYINADILQRMRVKSSASITIDCYVRERCQTNDMRLAFRNYNVQYPDEHCELHSFERSHDRFLIIDDEVYHFGASIKDLGKRWFSVNLITEHSAEELIARL